MGGGTQLTQRLHRPLPGPWHQGLPGAAPLWASAGRWPGPLLALGEARPVRRVWVEFQVSWLSFSPALHARLPET